MTDLPSGTVTFLFTDIAGSTERWERDRQGMAHAVERHLALLDAAIASHYGIQFTTVGDAVQAAFPTAPQAVAAAVEGQRVLLAEDLPGEHELTRASVPRLTAPAWARCGGSAAAASAGAPRARRSPGPP